MHVWAVLTERNLYWLILKYVKLVPLFCLKMQISSDFTFLKVTYSAYKKSSYTFIFFHIL